MMELARNPILLILDALLRSIIKQNLGAPELRWKSCQKSSERRMLYLIQHMNDRF